MALLSPGLGATVSSRFHQEAARRSARLKRLGFPTIVGLRCVLGLVERVAAPGLGPEKP